MIDALIIVIGVLFAAAMLAWLVSARIRRHVESPKHAMAARVEHHYGSSRDAKDSIGARESSDSPDSGTHESGKSGAAKPDRADSRSAAGSPTAGKALDDAELDELGEVRTPTSSEGCV